jgi:hypothetical protein
MAHLMSESDKICGLCGRNAPLRDSHVLPAFVFRWLKDTSATGYMRFAQSPNRRVQDGLKRKWLCGECEQTFSREETAFATKLFYPYLKDTSQRVPYSEWLMRFCVSISWRVLADAATRKGLGHLTTAQQLLAEQALDRWRAFLLGEVPHPGSFEQHMLPVDLIENAPFRGLPHNINRYLLRQVEMDLPRTSTQAFTFAKLGPILIFGFIQPPRDRWRGTKVAVRSGLIGPTNYELPKTLWNYLEDRARKNAEVHASVSDGQHDKIEADALRNIDRLASSGTFAAMRADERMFGPGAIIRKPKS